MEEIDVANVAINFHCKYCDYECSKKFNFDKHLATQKHKKTEMIANGVEIVKKPINIKELFNCGCGKQYKTKFSLARHKQTCDYKESKPEDINVYKDLLIDANKKNQLYEELFMDANKKIKQVGDLLIEANKKNKNLEEMVIYYEKFDRKQRDLIRELRKKQLDLEHQIIKLKR
tara:strand:- start:1976 stop:2497 length:522 start_codon:yes stop_codon:yes gene_type:complete